MEIEVFSKNGSRPNFPRAVLPLAKRVARFLRSYPYVVIGALLFSLVTSAAIFPHLFAVQGPLQTNFSLAFMPPLTRGETTFHLLGTDYIGRDVYSRVIYGTRSSMIVTFAVVFLSGILGSLIGFISGHFGGKLDSVLMRLVDIQLSFPPLLLALTVMAIVGPGIVNVIIVLWFTGWPVYARLVRAEAKRINEREFILAARMAGASPWRIIFKHIFPNARSTIIVIATIHFARVLIVESSLSFLGLGVLPPNPSWGMMLSDGRNYLINAWWIATFPGIAILLVALSVNLIGEGIRDLMDLRWNPNSA